jgi:hypothetical protein
MDANPVPRSKKGGTNEFAEEEVGNEVRSANIILNSGLKDR